VRSWYLSSLFPLAAAGLLTAALPAAAQSTFDPPKTSTGQPDIQGFWTERSDITTYSIQAGAIDREEHTRIGGQATQFGRPIVDPPDGMIPYQPWAAERAKFHNAQHVAPDKPEFLDPGSRCFLEGVPRIMYQGGFRLLQYPTYIVMMFDYAHHYRVVYLDDRPAPGDKLKLWMGYSKGHWEGNTLVVDVTNNNDKTWFDIVGSFHSDEMRITERWTFASADKIDYEATITDPKVYTQPWKLAMVLERTKGQEMWENAVCEGNKTVHVAFGIPFPGDK